ARERANVGLYSGRHQVGDVVGQKGALEGRLLLEDGHPGLEVRRLDVRDEAPLEARPQALLDFGNILRDGVAGEDDLFSRLVEVVEGVEEFLLRLLLSGDELNIIDQQEIDRRS